MSPASPVSGLTPEGISRDTTGDLTPSLFKANIESFIFFLKLPLRPVPINASTMTALLDIFNFPIDLLEIVFTLDSFISANAFFDAPFSSFGVLLMTTVTSRPNSFAKLPRRKPSPEFLPLEQKIINSSTGLNSLKMTSNENSAAICMSEYPVISFSLMARPSIFLVSLALYSFIST